MRCADYVSVNANIYRVNVERCQGDEFGSTHRRKCKADSFGVCSGISDRYRAVVGVPVTVTDENIGREKDRMVLVWLLEDSIDNHCSLGISDEN